MTTAPDLDRPPAAGPGGRRRRRWVSGSVALVVVAAVAGWLVFRPGGSSGERATAPAVSGPTAGGGRYSLAAEQGHWVLVNFFASWCTDCRPELAQLDRLERQHPAGVSVVSVDGLGDSFAKAAGLIKAAGGDWPLVNDPAALEAYRVTSLPQSFLVNPEGEIVDHVFGGVTAAALTAKLTARH